MRRASRGAPASPAAAAEGALQLDGRVQAAVGAVEGGEEAVALELDDLPVVMGTSRSTSR